MHICANLVDVENVAKLVLLEIIGFDTAEKEPSKFSMKWRIDSPFPTHHHPPTHSPTTTHPSFTHPPPPSPPTHRLLGVNLPNKYHSGTTYGDKGEMYNCCTRELWSDVKKWFCCENLGFGCPADPTGNLSRNLLCSVYLRVRTDFSNVY